MHTVYIHNGLLINVDSYNFCIVAGPRQFYYGWLKPEGIGLCILVWSLPLVTVEKRNTQKDTIVLI